eukprot:TRINITY_DN9293_c0_g1_i1.p1 TRINITY_DN9293_c0_g1~~TRINITY_DN9293_c0_g1_i1.p1  ORF type:complete len:127 (-),score=26.72 TRINITY_DN9293_c0_g1_i1:1-381(-)
MIYCRLRLEGFEGLNYQEMIFDSFWEDVESRMIASGISNPFILSSQQKKLSHLYFGFVFSLDEALVEGDAVLADSVWRNLYEMREDATPERLMKWVDYIRRELQNLDKTEGRLLFGGLHHWGEPPK